MANFGKNFGNMMDRICVLILCVFCVVCGAEFDDALIKKALDSGLESMPLGKELDELIGLDANKMQIELGKKLYFDPRISASNTISCNTCHNLGLGGIDGNPVSVGINLNIPTIYNSALNHTQSWKGDVDNLLDYVRMHAKNNAIMGEVESMSSKIMAIPQYVIEFKKAYGNEVIINDKLITDTISIFVMTLTTQSRYDDFLRGNIRALSRKEQRGLNVFIDKGCAVCHNGVNLGGHTKEISSMSDYRFTAMFTESKIFSDFVKIPTLRNVLETAPYMHNGIFSNISDIIRYMIKQPHDADNVGISDDDVDEIESFLHSLQGTKPNIVYPMLPTIF